MRRETGDETGCENIGPDDTGDADYGRLLERAERRLTQQGAVGGWLRRTA
jgi:hypothetical protein